MSERIGGPGGDGQSSDAYEPDISVRYDDGVVACDCFGGVFVG